MKKVIVLAITIIAISSCSTAKNMNTSNLADAATLLGSLSPNSKVQQITSLFSLLDSNKDAAISSTEAIGSVADNFKVLDTDSNSSLNLTELTGLLGLLK